MRPSTVLAIILTILLTTSPSAHALVDYPAPSRVNADVSDSTNAPFNNSTAIESATSSAIPKGNIPDCEGTVPSSGVVTALLSRIVRSPGNTHGKQCPIPPVPDHPSSEEPHK